MELGKKQKLVVVKTVDFGVYLGDRQDAGEMDRVLLPGKEVPEGTKEGDQMEVFLYKDSSDRLIATTRTPELMMDQVGFLKVAQVTKIGAFLSWGLEKDLFLPYKEQTKKVHEGEEVLVSLYIDKSSRLCATMKVYHYLKTGSPYIVGDTVTGVVYEQSDNFGVFVAVDGQYSGLIPKQDFEGVLPFDDKASPEIIQREFGLSKNAFKRAVGHLLKEEKIELKNHKIYIR